MAASSGVPRVSRVEYTGTPPETWDYAPEPGDPMWGPPALSDAGRRKRYREQLQRWLDDPYTLDARWQARAKRELNEDPKTVRDNVRGLRERLRQEPGLKPRTDDHFLLAFLRAKRHDQQLAYLSILKFYRMRKENPTYFELCLPSKNLELFKTEVTTMLEGYDTGGRPICYFSISPVKVKPIDFIKLAVPLLEFLVIDPRVQVSGITILCNLKNQTLAHGKELSVRFLKLVVQIFQGTFPVRIKRVIMCHGSFIFKTSYSILKPFLGEKFKERIVNVNKNMTQLPTYIPAEVIPPTLEGRAPAAKPTAWADRLALVEDLFIEWHKYGYKDDADLEQSEAQNKALFEEAGLEEPHITLSDKELQKQIRKASLKETDLSDDDEDFPASSSPSPSVDRNPRGIPDSNVQSNNSSNLALKTDPKSNITPNIQPKPTSEIPAPSGSENEDFEKCSDRRKARLKAGLLPPK